MTKKEKLEEARTPFDKAEWRFFTFLSPPEGERKVLRSAENPISETPPSTGPNRHLINFLRFGKVHVSPYACMYVREYVCV